MKIQSSLILRKIADSPNLQRIVANMGWLTLERLLHISVGVVLGIWLARYLGPEMFGVLSFALAFVGLFRPIANLGLRQIVVRELVVTPEGQAQILAASAALRLLSGITAYALIVFAIILLQPDDALAKALVLLVGLTVIINTSEIAAFWFEAHVLSKYTVIAGSLAILCFAAVCIVLLLVKAPVIAFATATVAEALMAALFLVIIFLRKGLTFSWWNLQWPRVLQLLRDSWPLFLSGIAIVVYMRIDQVMLGQILDSHAVGIYSVAVRLSEVWYFIPGIIIASLFPTIVATRERSEQQFYTRLQRLFDLMVWLAICISIPMTFLATPLVIWLFGAEYLEAGLVLAIHIWTTIFVFLGMASSKWFIVENRQILSLKRSVIGVFVNICLNFAFIPRFGPAGAAWATLISQAVAAFLVDALSTETRHLFRMKLRTAWPKSLWTQRTTK